jgi:hypothetical protein
MLGLPLLGQPLDRAGRQAGGILAQQIPQRRPEVARREPVQVQDREHLGHLRRAPRVRRQDPRAEPLALPGLLVDPLVIDPRRPDRHCPRTDGHAPLPGATVADHQPLAILANLVHERAHVLVNLGLQRGGDHPTSALPRQIIERAASLVVLPDREPANICHGVPSFPASRRSVFVNREGTPPSSSRASTTSGYSSAPGECLDATSRRWGVGQYS